MSGFPEAADRYTKPRYSAFKSWRDMAVYPNPEMKSWQLLRMGLVDGIYTSLWTPPDIAAAFEGVLDTINLDREPFNVAARRVALKGWDDMLKRSAQPTSLQSLAPGRERVQIFYEDGKALEAWSREDLTKIIIREDPKKPKKKDVSPTPSKDPQTTALPSLEPQIIEEPIVCEGWRLHKANKVAITPSGEERRLNSAETALLEHLLVHPRTEVSRDELEQLSGARMMLGQYLNNTFSGLRGKVDHKTSSGFHHFRYLEGKKSYIFEPTPLPTESQA